MNGDDRLDLSALEPVRWSATVDATLARVDALLARRQDPLTLIASWTRPLLVAAALAVGVLVPLELALDAEERRAEQVDRLVALSAEIQVAAPPSGEEFRRALVRAAP